MTNKMTPAIDEMESMLGMGTINGRAVLKTLNSNILSPTEVFLRETVQNSFDAKKSDVDHINFQMRAFKFPKEQYEYLLSLFPLKDKNDEPSFFKRNILKNLAPDMINLEVTDTNTTGLIGTAGIPEGEDAKKAKQNFYNFVYGTGNDKEQLAVSGGSYGFGKAALYLYSKARIILIYSKTHKKNGEYKSKFIIVSNIENVKDNGADRCWWGSKKSFKNRTGEYIAPLVATADIVAQNIGFTPFEAEETGTKLLLLNAGPTLNEFRAEKRFEDIFKKDMPRYIVHWYWPKIITNEIKFSLIFEDKEIPIDDIENVYPYNIFAQALRYYNNPGSGITRFGFNSNTYRKVEYGNQKQLVGTVALKESIIQKKPDYSDLLTIFNTNNPVIACMRAIGHIVYYYEVPIPTGNISIQKTYYGIFKVDPKASYFVDGEKILVDNYFREMENTTHDEWGHKKDFIYYPYDFIKSMQNTCTSMLENLVLPNISDDNDNIDLSVLIQRALGEKLKLNTRTTTGGAGIILENTSLQHEESIKIKKSTIKPTGYIDVIKLEEKKILKIKCKVLLSEGKNLSIKNVIFEIKDLDGNKVESKEHNELEYLTILPEKIDTDKTKLSEHTQSNIIIKKRGFYDIYVQSNEECAFTIQIDYEEVNA